MFALLGFEQAVQLGGEAANPERNLPRAVILSILIGAGIYILLQVVFIGSISPSLLASQHTWTNLGASNANPAVVALNAGPFYTVTKVAGLAWLAFVLRLDAVICPFGTGLLYATTSSRISLALARNGYVPDEFERTSKRTHVPVFGVLFATGIGLLFLLPFPSWSKLVGIATSSSVLMYAGAPLALAALRKTKPDLPRVYRLPAARDVGAARVRVRELDHLLVRVADADHADGRDADRLRTRRAVLPVPPQPGRAQARLACRRRSSFPTSSACS